jgi:hypothetical protein
MESTTAPLICEAGPPPSAPLTITAIFPGGLRQTLHLSQSDSVSNLIAALRLPLNTAIVHQRRILQLSDPLHKLEPSTVRIAFRVELPATANGFDRLLGVKLSESEIGILRKAFHRFQGTESAGSEDRMRIEEEWAPLVCGSENPLELFRELELLDEKGDFVVWEFVGQQLLCFVIGVLLGPISLVVMCFVGQGPAGAVWLFAGAVLHYFIWPYARLFKALSGN